MISVLGLQMSFLLQADGASWRSWWKKVSVLGAWSGMELLGLLRIWGTMYQKLLQSWWGVLKGIIIQNTPVGNTVGLTLFALLVWLSHLKTQKRGERVVQNPGSMSSGFLHWEDGGIFVTYRTTITCTCPIRSWWDFTKCFWITSEHSIYWTDRNKRNNQRWCQRIGCLSPFSPPFLCSTHLPWQP